MSGGGGSSGGGSAYYANQDKMLGTQADISQNLYNQYAAYAPTYLSYSADMVDEAQSGALGARARAQAGADASQALSTGLDGARRAAGRYGAEFNADRLAATAADAVVAGAANKAGAMNAAGQWAEDQKWNRNAGAYGQIAGMGTGAMSGLSSAAAGYGGMGNSAASMGASNAAGAGKFGAAIGASLFKADGGYVRGLRLASGGSVRARRTPVPMARVDWRNQATTGRGASGSVLSGVAMGMAPYALAPALKAAWNGTGKDSLFGETRGLRAMFTPEEQATPGTATYDANGYYATGADATTNPYYAGDAGSSTADVGSYATSGPDWVNTSTYEPSNYVEVGSENAPMEWAYADGGAVRGLRLARGGSVRYQLPFLDYGTEDTSGAGVTGGSAFDPRASTTTNHGGTGAAQNAWSGQGEGADGAAPAGSTGYSFAHDYPVLSRILDTGVRVGASMLGGPLVGAAVGLGLNAVRSSGAEQDRKRDAQQLYQNTMSSSTASDARRAQAERALRALQQQPVVTPQQDVPDGGVVGPAQTGGGTSSNQGGTGAAQNAWSGSEPSNYVSQSSENAPGNTGFSFNTGPSNYVSQSSENAPSSTPSDDGMASGGAVKRGLPARKDMKPGGKVTGPGTETSDSIPAWLSDGEYVLNAEAVKIAGKDKLEALNQRGLKARRGKRGGKKTGLPPRANLNRSRG